MENMLAKEEENYKKFKGSDHQVFIYVLKKIQKVPTKLVSHHHDRDIDKMLFVA